MKKRLAGSQNEHFYENNSEQIKFFEKDNATGVEAETTGEVSLQLNVKRVDGNKTAEPLDEAAHLNAIQAAQNSIHDSKPEGQWTSSFDKQRQKRNKSQPTKQKKFKKLKVAALIVATFLLVLTTTGVFLWQKVLGNIKIIDANDLNFTIPEEYDVNEPALTFPVPFDEDVINILLLGTDTRVMDVKQTNTLTDSIMLLTINREQDTIKLTSFQRDILVYLPGKDKPVKLNSANAAGGPGLVMKTLNNTFRLGITKYAIVNMYGMEELIDALPNGVEIDVPGSRLALKDLNDNIFYMADEVGGHEPYIREGGMQRLNGRQAVAFSRIRYSNPNGDYDRMKHQRQVMQAMLNEFKNIGANDKLNFISTAMGYVTTNLTKTEIMGLGITSLASLNDTIEQYQIPMEGHFRNYEGSVWVSLCDFNGMIPKLQEALYGKTFDFDKVKVIPGAPGSGIDPGSVYGAKKETKKTPEETKAGLREMEEVPDLTLPLPTNTQDTILEESLTTETQMPILDTPVITDPPMIELPSPPIQDEE